LKVTRRVTSKYLSEAAALLLIVSVVLGSFAGLSNMSQQQTQGASSETKIDLTLLDEADSNEQVDVLVSYDQNRGESEARNAIETVDRCAKIAEVFNQMNMMRVKLLGSAIKSLAASSIITGIWSNEMMKVSSDARAFAGASSGSMYESPVDTTGARSLWDKGYNGTGVVIAVLDTGVDFYHGDLDDFDDNPNTTDSKVTAYASFVEGDTLPVDIIGHGTYSASIAAGTGNMSQGLYKGIAPGATLLSAKVTLGGLYAAPSWIVSGIEWACSRGADIILMPFNTFGSPGDAVTAAVKNAAGKGVFIVAAAGDDGPDYLTIMSPGGNDGVLTVGAYDTAKAQVPSFSGRGPSLTMLTKPDIVAPGVGIVGAKAGQALSSAGFGTFNLEDLGGLSSLLGGSFGQTVNDYYIRADSTTAAAAVTAGAAALLMEAFDRATPIVLTNILRDTATPLNAGANDAGAGLLNITRAFDYLASIQSPIEPHNRTTGIPLVAYGLLSTQGRGASTTILMSSFGTSVVALDQRAAQNASVHLLMGMFSLRWENRSPTNLMEFNVKRELHQVVMSSGINGYNRWIGVLSYDSLYVILLVESYNLTLTDPNPITGFKVTPFILNLGDRQISNVSLFLSFSLDLFLDGEIDHGKFALQNKELFAYSISSDYKSFYFGLNSSRSLNSFEVGNSSTISSHVSNDNLSSSTSFDGTVGLAAKWDFGVVYPDTPVNLTVAMGYAENRTMLDTCISTMWRLSPSTQFAGRGDLIVIEADIPRVAIAGQTYQSRAIIMNVGANTSQAVGAMIVGQGGTGGGTIFSRFYTYSEVKPFHAEILTTEWSPAANGLYSAAWVVAAGIEFAVALFANPAAMLATSGVGLLDDFLLRDLFVVTPIPSTSVFPRLLPFAPFDIQFPSDFGLYTFSLSTNVPLGNVSVAKYGNASDWGNITLPAEDSVEGYYNFSLFLFVPSITPDGYHRCDYQIYTDDGWTANITLERRLQYPRAMMLMDTSHGGGLSFGLTGQSELSSTQTSGDSVGLSLGLASLSDLSSISDLLEQMRLTTFSGLSEMKRSMALRGLDLIETPGVSPTAELLSQFSTIFIVSPSKEFNSTEIDLMRNFTADGGRLVIFGDYEGRANLTALNLLLSPYGYVMSGKHTEENTSEIVQSSPLGHGLEYVWLGGGTYVLNNQSNSAVTLHSMPVVLVDQSPPDLVLFGSSRIFMNKNLPKCNNTLLLDNLNEYLLANTLTCTTSLAENTTSYPVGRSVYINLRVSDYEGNPVNNLTIFIAFKLPNGSLAFFIAGFVQEGLYSSQFTPSYYSSAGRVYGIFIIMKTQEYASTFAGVVFDLFVPTTTTTNGGFGALLTMLQVAVLTSVGVFGSTILVLTVNRVRRKRKMRIPELDPELEREIDNSLNNLLAAFIQMEELIHRADLDRVQKIETLRGLMKGLEEARKRFDKVSRTIGGV